MEPMPASASSARRKDSRTGSVVVATTRIGAFGQALVPVLWEDTLREAMLLSISVCAGFLAGVLVVVLAGLAVLAYGALLISRRNWWSLSAFVGGFFAAVLVTAVMALSLPSLTDSSLAQTTYITDWVMLVLMAAGFGAVAFVIVYPLLVLMGKKKV